MVNVARPFPTQVPPQTQLPDEQPVVREIPLKTPDGSVVYRVISSEGLVEPEQKRQKKSSEIRPKDPAQVYNEYQLRKRAELADARAGTRALLATETVYKDERGVGVNGVRPSTVDPSPQLAERMQRQIEANAGAVSAKRGELPSPDRPRYDALDERLKGDPDSRLSLQRMLLEGKLSTPELEGLSKMSDAELKRAVRERATPERREP